MKGKIILITALFCISIVVPLHASSKGSYGKHSMKLNKTKVISDCVGLPHGELVRCMYENMRQADRKYQPLPYSPNMKRVQIKGVPNRMSREKNPIPMSVESLEKGKKFYSQNCEVCHGRSGHGDGPILMELGLSGPNLTTPFLQNVNDGDFLLKISEGGWPMPAFGYQAEWSKDDLWHVINYIRSLSANGKNQ